MWRVVLVVLLLAQPSMATAQSEGAETAAQPAPVEEIAPGVFVRVGVHALMNEQNLGAIANIGFIVGEEAVAVIDSGGSLRDGRRLRAAIRERTSLPIRYVINTHMHPDHVFGNAAFLVDKPQFVGHERLPRALAARGGHYLQANARQMGPAFEGTTVVPPELLVEDRLSLDLGARVLTLQAYPTAHTDNDLSVYDETSGIVWTGDLLFVEHLPVVDGSLKGWLAVIERLAGLPAKGAVPGHGPAVVSWPEDLEPQRSYLLRLAADLRRLIAEGTGMREASEIAGQSERDRWRLFDEFNARNATAGYAELEWE